MKSAGNLFHGCGTALITPFRPDLSIDETALRRLVSFQVDQGIDFLVPGGTTGESATLSTDEHVRVIEIVVDESRNARRRVPILGGAGGNNTAHVIALARRLETLGIDGILSVAPYYNKPTQEGLYQHFSAIAQSVSLPVIVYNVPGRTSSNIEPATLGRLAGIGNIVGVKEASGNISQMGDVLAAVPEEFVVLSGDDAMALPLIALGGKGVISVVSNEIPREMTELVRFALAGEFARARELHFKFLPLMEVNFIESNPVPVKAAMARMGFCEEIYRLPLVPLRKPSRDKLESVLDSVLAASSSRLARR